MKKIRIGIDVDSVIADFENLFIEEFNKLSNKKIQKEHLTNWYYGKAIQKVYGDEVDVTLVEGIITNPQFVLNLPFIENAKDVILDLIDSDNFEPVIVTAIQPYLIEYRKQWFKNHFENIDLEIHYTNKKDEIDIDYLIDDAEHNLIALENKIGKDNCLCIKMNYNLDSKFKLFDKLEDAVNYIKLKETK